MGPVPGGEVGPTVPRPEHPVSGECHHESTEAEQAASAFQGDASSADSLEGIDLDPREPGEPVSWQVVGANPSGFHLLRQRDLERELKPKVVRPVEGDSVPKAVRPCSVRMKTLRPQVTIIRGEEGRKVRLVRETDL